MRAIGNSHAVFLQPLQGLLEVIDAEADVISHMPRSRLEVVSVFPQLRPLRLRVLHGKDDEVDVVHDQRRVGSDLESAIDARILRAAAEYHTQLFHVPVGSGCWIFAEKVYMPKTVMRRGIQLDKLMIGTIDIGEEELAGSIAAADIADIGDRCLKPGAAIQLFLVYGFHILRAPADMPDRRGDLCLGGLLRFVKKHP